MRLKIAKEEVKIGFKSFPLKRNDEKKTTTALEAFFLIKDLISNQSRLPHDN